MFQVPCGCAAMALEVRWRVNALAWCACGHLPAPPFLPSVKAPKQRWQHGTQEQALHQYYPQVQAKKDKCVHPTRPVKDACPDCPRRKGKGVVAEMQESPNRTLEVCVCVCVCVCACLGLGGGPQG